MDALLIRHEVDKVQGLVSNKTELTKMLMKLTDYERNIVLNAFCLLRSKAS